MLKSSLQTFMNAFTFPDKTMYPVCSRNEKDFLNLMDVYLDAVFHPLCVTRKEIFLQEGWHYELDDPEGELTCNGVVYNEMKGMYAPEGPAGPKGDTGGQGPAGPAGPVGPAGPAGQVTGLGWSNANLLDNWYFRDPINQKGQKIGRAHV